MLKLNGNDKKFMISYEKEHRTSITLFAIGIVQIFFIQSVKISGFSLNTHFPVIEHVSTATLAYDVMLIFPFFS